ncbi:ATP-binding protein [Corynebacterium gerontici]|uniref:Bacterial regulatory protein, arsR family n=1 Tax=Corynebacterium gerontici TaxID=2079234 RepID=A0A3G6J213_9CORY|nr:ATP-binding protein [Corynebacterium gerontici]AZA10420.1 Bacterial regulatory protein, arsR family [Corynebacterium gerontici]
MSVRPNPSPTSLSAQAARVVSQGKKFASAELPKLRESQWFSKLPESTTARELAITLLSFHNAEGGTIIYPGGRELFDEARNLIHPDVRAHFRDYPDFSLVYVDPWHYFHELNNGDCFMRVGTRNRKLNLNQRQELAWDREVEGFTARSVGNTAYFRILLDQKLLGEFQRALGTSSPKKALRARDLLTQEGHVCIAAYLLLAKRPQTMFPYAFVEVRGEHEVIRCEGSIPEQIRAAARGVEKLGTAVPPEAWLEGLRNAVIHRSYAMAGDHVRVRVFDNRIEITSPGRFPNNTNPHTASRLFRNARNPRVARVCADLGVSEARGAGIRRMCQAMRDAGFADPQYQQFTEAVRLTLFSETTTAQALPKSMSATATRIVNELKLADKPLGTGQLTALLGLARPTVLRHLNALREQGLVQWHGRSKRDPLATWSVR